MTIMIRLLVAPLPVLLISLVLTPRILVTKMMTVLRKHVTPLDLNLMGGERVQYWLTMLKKKKHSSTLSATSNYPLSLSDQFKFWTSKFTMRDSYQLIDVASAACGSSSTIPIGATGISDNVVCHATSAIDVTIFRHASCHLPLHHGNAW
jgi:hypothetical protein